MHVILGVSYIQSLGQESKGDLEARGPGALVKALGFLFLQLSEIKVTSTQGSRQEYLRRDPGSQSLDMPPLEPVSRPFFQNV